MLQEQVGVSCDEMKVAKGSTSVNDVMCEGMQSVRHAGAGLGEAPSWVKSMFPIQRHLNQAPHRYSNSHGDTNIFTV